MNSGLMQVISTTTVTANASTRRATTPASSMAKPMEANPARLPSQSCATRLSRIGLIQAVANGTRLPNRFWSQ